jgi:hypothetical protein
MMRNYPSPEIKFDNINVNAIESSAGIFVGTNTQLGWGAHSKHNTGFGSITGKFNLVVHTTNIIMDNDVIDTPIDDRDVILDQHQVLK